MLCQPLNLVSLCDVPSAQSILHWIQFTVHNQVEDGQKVVAKSGDDVLKFDMKMEKTEETEIVCKTIQQTGAK